MSQKKPIFELFEKFYYFSRFLLQMYYSLGKNLDAMGKMGLKTFSLGGCSSSLFEIMPESNESSLSLLIAASESCSVEIVKGCT